MKRRDQTAGGAPRDGKRTDRAKQLTRERRRIRTLKYHHPQPRLER
jgi:hypothetical protein